MERDKLRRRIVQDAFTSAEKLRIRLAAWREAMPEYEPAWSEFEKACGHIKLAGEHLDAGRRE